MITTTPHMAGSNTMNQIALVNGCHGGQTEGAVSKRLPEDRAVFATRGRSEL